MPEAGLHVAITAGLVASEVSTAKVRWLLGKVWVRGAWLEVVDAERVVVVRARVVVDGLPTDPTFQALRPLVCFELAPSSA